LSLNKPGAAEIHHQLIEDTESAYDIFSGLPDIQFPSSLRVGAIGMIAAPGLFGPQVTIYKLMMERMPEVIGETEHICRGRLTFIIFMMSSVENFITSGKRLLAKRLKLKLGGAGRPSIPGRDFGIEIMSHWAEHLGPLPGGE